MKLFSAFISDVSPLLFPQVYDSDYIRSVDTLSKSVHLPNWTCNDCSVTSFDFSQFPYLESLEIGDNCYCSVESFHLTGYSQLKSVKIGMNSFTKMKINDWSSFDSEWRKMCIPAKSFRISNCPSLESIEIGDYSFSDFGGQFELEDLSSLQSIIIGSRERDSHNFYCSSFFIRSIHLHFKTIHRSSESAVHSTRKFSLFLLIDYCI